MSLLSSDIRSEAPPRRGAERVVLSTAMPSVSARSRRLNRAVDVAVALAVLVVAAPVMLAIAAAIRFTSPGPVIFRQQRVGRGGRLFEVLKFRTMANGTHDEVLNDPEMRAIYELNDFKLPGDDPRITRVGRWLRRTSLDELPQLVNVLRGEMGLVGVRPIEYEQLVSRPQYDQDLYCYHRPALTGLWQVAGRSEYRDTHRIELDRQCLEQWSVRENFKILVRTPKAVLAGAGAH